MLVPPTVRPVSFNDGWPTPSYELSVKEAIGIVLNEEYLHRQYAERDLAILESGASNSG